MIGEWNHECRSYIVFCIKVSPGTVLGISIVIKRHIYIVFCNAGVI